jgi:TRAP-type C4-dicarboxylate transport system permease small subunit
MNAGTIPERLIRLLTTLERVVIATLMAVITVLTLAQVFWRYGLNMPLQWSEEIARYCFVWVTFYVAVGPRVQRATEIAGRLVVIGGTLAIAIGGFRMVQLQWHQLSPSIEVPMAWIYLAMVVGPLIGLFWTIWCAWYGCVEDEP